MMSLVPVVALGLAASFLLALAAFLQQRVARHQVPEGGEPVRDMVRLMGRLVRDRKWLAGWGVNLTGFFTQATALHLGSVAAVQPLMATQLMFALPMSSLERRRWPQARDVGAALAICAGLATLLLVEGSPLRGEPDRGRVLLATGAALVLFGCFLLAARLLSRERVASVLMAAAAGLCFAMTAVFMKLTADDLIHQGVAETARDWVGYALAGSTLLGLVVEQSAFAGGPLPWAVATMNTVNPVTSYAAGVLAFRVTLPTDPGTLAGIAAAGALVSIGAVGLAHSPSVRVWFPEGAAER